MSAEESIIWGRFLSKFGSLHDSFNYDLRVGNGISPDVPIPNKFTADYEDLTKKRIDAVGYIGNQANIYEVKQRGNLSALGQLLGYHALFMKSFPNYPVAGLFLVCSSISPEDHKIISSNGITVVVI